LEVATGEEQAAEAAGVDPDMALLGPVNAILEELNPGTGAG
jgi:hypothetical protein